MSPPPSPSALLCIWHDVEPDHVAEYLRWHTFEHLPERLGLPGFVSARRYERVDGPGQRFCCFLDASDLSAFQSPEYRERLDAPTEWTRRLMPRYSRVHRALCETRWEIGGGQTGLIACLRIAGRCQADLCAALRAACSDLRGRQLILRARLGALDQAVTGRDSEEKRLRQGESSGGYDLVLLVDALDPASLRAVCSDLAALLAARNLRSEISSYRLSCSIHGRG